jgi:hypothetical protein
MTDIIVSKFLIPAPRSAAREVHRPLWCVSHANADAQLILEHLAPFGTATRSACAGIARVKGHSLTVRGTPLIEY